jgi:hypothetical protein
MQATNEPSKKRRQWRRPPSVAAIAVLLVVAASACASGDEAGVGARPPVAASSPGASPTVSGDAVRTPPSSAGGEPAPAVLTQQADGQRFSLAPGQDVALQLDSAWSWSVPELSGDTVVLSPVDHLVDPGYVEWVVTGQTAGTAEIIASGEPKCPDAARCPPTTVRIVLDIG